MTDEQDERAAGQALLQVNGIFFLQIDQGDNYILYQAQEQRKIGPIVIDIFLEQVPDKGWWGAFRMIGAFRIQVSINHTTLFPTPEIAHVVVEEFLADEQEVRKTLVEMHENKLNLKTFHNEPNKPENVDPEMCFSPLILEVDGTYFTLVHITNTEASYRSWVRRSTAEITFELRMAHIYWRGWTAWLYLSHKKHIMFEPAIDQLYPTPEKALAAMLEFSTNEEQMRQVPALLTRASSQEKGQQYRIMVTKNSAEAPAKPPLRVNFEKFVWQKHTSQGDFYRSNKVRSISSHKIYVWLVETWRGEWIASLQLDDLIPVTYFEKEDNRGFSTPKEALAHMHKLVSFKKDTVPMLHEIYRAHMLLQRKIGKYDWISSIKQ